MQNFPLELHDQIIDHLWDDRPALAACALTCNTWLPRVRLHRFSSVKLRQSDDCTRFDVFLNAPLLQSHTIAHLVDTLMISSSPGGNGQEVHDTEWLRSVLPQVLVKLDRVRCLCLDNFKWCREMLPSETMQSILTFSPVIKTLHLRDVAFEESDDFLRTLLPAYSHLDSVHLQYVTFRRYSHARTDSAVMPSRPDRSSVALQMNKIVTDPTSYLVLLFGQLNTSLQLTVDTLEFTNYDMLDSVRAVLSLQCAQAFTAYLTTQCEQRSFLDTDIRFGQNFLMTTLQINCAVEHSLLSYDWLPRILSLVPLRQQNLVTLTFGTHASNDIRLDILDWPRLDPQLVVLVEHLPQLVIVFHYDIRVEGSGDGWLAGLLDLISARLPQLCSRTARKSRVGVTCSTSATAEDGRAITGSLQRWL